MQAQDVFTLISATGPFEQYKDNLMTYGQLLGSWEMEAHWYDAQGGHKEGKGEWHFRWILGGWGMQDVLFAAGSPAHTYGTTVRCYDPQRDVWHISWMQPSGGEFVHLVGQKVGDAIVQEGQGPDLTRRERWTFKNITPDSFLWLGEVSRDDGKTWFLEQEMKGRRVS